MVNCAFFVSGFIAFFFIDSCKALLISSYVKRCYIKWKNRRLLIIPELRVLMLTKRHVGSGSEIVA